MKNLRGKRTFWKRLKLFWVYQNVYFKRKNAKITPGKIGENDFAHRPKNFPVTPLITAQNMHLCSKI